MGIIVLLALGSSENVKMHNGCLRLHMNSLKNRESEIRRVLRMWVERRVGKATAMMTLGSSLMSVTFVQTVWTAEVMHDENVFIIDSVWTTDSSMASLIKKTVKAAIKSVNVINRRVRVSSYDMTSLTLRHLIVIANIRKMHSCIAINLHPIFHFSCE